MPTPMGQRTAGGGVAQAQVKHRRRPTNPTEQARRRAWGKQWGAILREHAQTYERKA